MEDTAREDGVTAADVRGAAAETLDVVSGVVAVAGSGADVGRSGLGSLMGTSSQVVGVRRGGVAAAGSAPDADPQAAFRAQSSGLMWTGLVQVCVLMRRLSQARTGRYGPMECEKLMRMWLTGQAERCSIWALRPIMACGSEGVLGRCGSGGGADRGQRRR